jgi:YihY family inner membrane protein
MSFRNKQRTQVGLYGKIKKITERIGRENIPTISSGIAFNVLLCLIPFLLVTTSLFGLFLQRSDATQRVDNIIATMFPTGSYAVEIKGFLTKVFSDIMRNRQRFGIVGIGMLLWSAGSLFGAIRRVLNTLYRIEAKKLFLLKIAENIILVVFLGLLFLIANLFTWFLKVIDSLMQEISADAVFDPHIVSKYFPAIAAYFAAFIMFYIINRYMPDRKIPSRAAIIAAFTTTTLWWFAGRIFTWYVTTFHPFHQLYGTYAFLFIFLLWIYYSSMVFIIGVIVGQIYREISSRPPAV